jgi:hypothetical protein
MGIAWAYNGKEFTEDMIGDYCGFVYLITNLSTGRKYIGKKQFYSAKTKQVKKKKKKFKVTSNWQTYFGSSEILLKDVIMYGEENFSREIIHLCQSKGECSYLESKEQFQRSVLESDEYYNTWIMCRVRKSHIKDYNARMFKTSSGS